MSLVKIVAATITLLQLAAVAAIIWLIRKSFLEGSPAFKEHVVKPVEDATEAVASFLGVDAETGFEESQGQNDQRLLYAQARTAEADRQGLVGDARQHPAGFPTFEQWQDNQVASTNWWWPF